MYFSFFKKLFLKLYLLFHAFPDKDFQYLIAQNNYKISKYKLLV